MEILQLPYHKVPSATLQTIRAIRNACQAYVKNDKTDEVILFLLKI